MTSWSRFSSGEDMAETNSTIWSKDLPIAVSQNKPAYTITYPNRLAASLKLNIRRLQPISMKTLYTTTYHNSPAGLRCGRCVLGFDVTEPYTYRSFMTTGAKRFS